MVCSASAMHRSNASPTAAGKLLLLLAGFILLLSSTNSLPAASQHSRPSVSFEFGAETDHHSAPVISDDRLREKFLAHFSDYISKRPELQQLQHSAALSENIARNDTLVHLPSLMIFENMRPRDDDDDEMIRPIDNEENTPSETNITSGSSGSADEDGEKTEEEKLFLDPLIVTPWLDLGLPWVARWLAEVGHIVDGLQESYAGFFNVNALLGSNLFFWLFKAKNGNPTAPLLLWLNGGPGSASTLGLLLENGPLTFDPVTLEPIVRDVAAWTDEYDVLYIDQPVGAGFSHTSTLLGYAFTQEDYTRDLYEAVRQFFQLFPNYRERDFYITGVSYAGKYIPCLAEKLHQENQKPGGPRFPLTGIALINGFTDPPTAFQDLGPFLYHHGLIDRPGLQLVDYTLTALVDAMNNQSWMAALLLLVYVSDTEIGLLQSLTGYNQAFNVADPEWPGVPTLPYITHDDFLSQRRIREAIHVGDVPFGWGYDTQDYLAFDLPRPAKPQLELLLDQGYKVLMLNGLLDIILGPRAGTGLLYSANWRYSKEYKVAEQEQVTDAEGTLVGYVTKVRNLWQAKVLGGTHYAPSNVPVPIYNILRDFIAADV